MNTIDTEWLTAARDLLTASSEAGMQVQRLEKEAENNPYDSSRANLSARTLRYRLERLRAEAKQAQATGEPAENLLKLTVDLQAVKQLAAQERDILKQDIA